ncbi:MAG: universal stress protein [Flavobacteriales bacterium]|nr:universal stress protein [Flavobacteriales bacterium]MCW8912931.1 universal stress protein [Flavobacteriales bacterium]MCW8938733.1 universal stress protein [Flavobacteriales bacterium]MCW8967950.1 universal stress protein [Flavobacteriales bacterium]MCW8988932.1 universal stress protein [Flavobacteriales bacterium]
MMTILLPTDFSKNAKNAILYALELYKNQEVNFILMNAFHPTHDDMANSITGGSLNDLLSQASEKQLQELITEIKGKHISNKHHSFSFKSAYGSLVEIIDTFVDKHPIDLIVMGAKGMSAVEKIVFGSNTYAVIKEVDCPALVIPDNVTFTHPSNLSIATDFKEIKNKKIFSVLQTLLNDYKPEVTMFNVTEEMKPVGAEEKQMAQSIANILNIDTINTTYFKHEDVIYGTKEYVKQHNTSLMVLVNKKRNFFEDLFHISFTKQISFHAEIPLLILHD